MSDGFESHLETLFATQPKLADAELFALQVERKLEQDRRWWTLVAAALAVFGLGVSFPLFGGVLANFIVLVMAVFERAGSLTSGAAIATSAAMAVILAVAALMGVRQASSL